MMSSEEDAECFGLYGDKLLKKAKRTRQRVDAGEPRNSYSSIPNFSSRPSFLSGSLYGAIFSSAQGQQAHFGGLFGSAKMLNELLGRQAKDSPDADAAAAKIAANNNNGFDCLNATSVIRRGLEEDGADSPPPGELAHHMLRDILQGRKKELLQLEQELRGVSVSGGDSVPSPDNNNSITSNNNNNNELKNGGAGTDCSDTELGGANTPAATNHSGKQHLNVNGTDLGMDVDVSGAEDDAAAAVAMEEALNEAGVVSKNDLMEEALNNMNGGAGSDSEQSLASPSSDCLPNDKDNGEDSTPAPTGEAKDSQPSPCAPTANGPKPEQMELKRARVENIVSSMRSSPSLPTQVNGCKKRKLYHPQQHDNSAAERYAASQYGLGLGMLLDDDEELVEPPEVRQKRVEKNALKSQLRTMQEQLAEMQQKYVQLCTRMEQESDCQDTEDVLSDLEQDGSSMPLPDKPQPVTSTPTSTPVKETSVPCSPVLAPAPPPSAAVTKLAPAKMHPHAHLGAHQHPIMPTLNGGLSMLHQQQHAQQLQHQHQQHEQQQQQQQQQHQPQQQQHPQQQHPQAPYQHSHHQHPHPQHPHAHPHAISSAAAMYLGHKLFLEQEARLAKDAAVAAAVAEQQQQQHQQQHQQQQQQQQQPHHHQQQQQQQQQLQQHQHQQQAPQPPPQSQPGPHPPPPPPPPQQQQMQKASSVSNDFAERFSMFRSNVAAMAPVSGSDLEGLADVLKTEITASLTGLIDSIVARFVQQRRFLGKQSEVAAAAAAAAEQLNKDLLMASQMLDRKSPRTKVIDRGGGATGPGGGTGAGGGGQGVPRMNGTTFPSSGMSLSGGGAGGGAPENNINTMNLQHVRPSPNASMFQTPKAPGGGTGGVNSSAAALYSSMGGMGGGGGGPHMNPFCMPENSREGMPEQNEALSLVVTPKKKRHKVTDTRITPRTVSRILAQDGMVPPPGSMDGSASGGAPSGPGVTKFGSMMASTSGGAESPPPPRPYHPPPPPILPVSLPTSVAIPNPSLHESQVFSPYSPFYHHQQQQQAPPPPPPHQHMASSSPPGMGTDPRGESPPLQHPPTLLHPALIAAAQHGGSPDYGHMRGGGGGGADSVDRNSDCNSADGPYDGIQPTSSTLTPMHLRKAKLMFFWVRYPSSAVLKMYFPDIKFNKNNTAQLVKWFSNFREFYYIQMEKYARQAVSEGAKNADDLHVGADSEIYRVLNLHYNRNNHIEVPSNFRYVVEQTLREFFKAIQGGKDTEQSWKKSIYKIISRLDDPVPEYFKSPNFLEQLE